jgi:hypothetical protein
LVGLILISKFIKDLKNLIGINLINIPPLKKFSISLNVKEFLGTPAKVDFSIF